MVAGGTAANGALRTIIDFFLSNIDECLENRIDIVFRSSFSIHYNVLATIALTCRYGVFILSVLL